MYKTMDLIGKLIKSILHNMIYVNNIKNRLSGDNYIIVCKFINEFDINEINKYNINPERVHLYFIFYDVMFKDISERYSYINMDNYTEIKSKIDLIEDICKINVNDYNFTAKIRENNMTLTDIDLYLTMCCKINNEQEEYRKKQYNDILTLLDDIVLVNMY